MKLFAHLINPRSRRLDPASIPLRPKSNSNIWGHLVRLTKVSLVLALVGLLFTIFLPEIQRAQHYESQKAEWQAKINEAQQRTIQMQAEFNALKSDPYQLERVARDTLGLGRPGEVIFRFEAYPTPKAGTTSH
jgi:cell division protein FtsB